MSDQYTYPYDPTGLKPECKVSNEVYDIPSHGMTGFRYIVSRHGPFYRKGLIVTHLANNTVLEDGVDFYCGHMFRAAIKETGREVYSSIVFADPTLTGEVTVTCQVLGGEYAMLETELLEDLSEQIINPRTVAWEHLVDLPETFPPKNHGGDINDTVGWKDVVEVWERIEGMLFNMQDSRHRHFIDDVEELPQELRWKASNKGEIKAGLVTPVSFANHTGAIAIRLPRFDRVTKVVLSVVIIVQGKLIELAVGGTIEGYDSEAEVGYLRGNDWNDAWARHEGDDFTLPVRCSYTYNEDPTIFIGNDDTEWDFTIMGVTEVYIDHPNSETYDKDWIAYRGVAPDGTPFQSIDNGAKYLRRDNVLSEADARAGIKAIDWASAESMSQFHDQRFLEKHGFTFEDGKPIAKGSNVKPVWVQVVYTGSTNEPGFKVNVADRFYNDGEEVTFVTLFETHPHRTDIRTRLFVQDAEVTGTPDVMSFESGDWIDAGAEFGGGFKYIKYPKSVHGIAGVKSIHLQEELTVLGKKMFSDVTPHSTSIDEGEDVHCFILTGTEFKGRLVLG